MAGVPFATAAELAAVWRPLSSEEETRATALIARASRMIRFRWPDVDDRIAAETLDADLVKDVVLEMVQSAMVAPALGITEASQGSGPFSESYKYDNPAGRLYFTAAMLALLDGSVTTIRMGWLA